MKIKIGFSKPKSLFKPFAWLIRLIEWTPYSHVYVRSFSSLAGCDLIYQASGTQLNFMGLKHFEDNAVIIREFDFDIEDDNYRKYLGWAIRESGAPYGLLSAIGIGIQKILGLNKNPLSDRDATWFCSELAAKVLSDFVEIVGSPLDFETAGPKDIFNFCKEYSVIEVRD